MADTRQVIRTSYGALEYTLPVYLTEKTGKNISLDVVRISLGTAAAPGAWLTPDIVTHPLISKVGAQLLVGPGGSVQPDPDDYYVWLKITDDPEIVPVRMPLRVTII